MTDICKPRPLAGTDKLSSFDCGEQELNSWLLRHALQAAGSGSAQTYVATKSRSVVAYYAITTGAIEHEQTTARTSRGMPRHPIPVILLARLAVDLRFQSEGLGAALLRDALVRCVGVADQVGVRAILVHAKNSHAADFYSHHGFERSPSDKHHLIMLIKDIRKTLATS